MINSSVGYCPCGQEIWVEYLASDGKWFCRYFADEHNEVTFCPACGREIKEDELESM